MKTLIIRNPEEVYFTSDLHLHHRNILEYCNRPFSSLEEMDSTIIANWNNKLPHGSWVYILGDFCWGDRKMWCYFLSQLSGNKILIQGNHDKDNNIPKDKFVEVYSGFINVDVKDPETKENSQRMTLCHYPMLSWYQSHRGSWQLFGHMHNATIKPLKKHEEDNEVEDFLKTEYKYIDKIRSNQYDVGVDGNNFTPVSYYEIKGIIKSKTT